MANGYLGLPPIAKEEFNRLSKQYYPEDAVCWMKDDRNPGRVETHEVAICEKGKGDLRPFIQGRTFTPLFDNRYAKLIELRRQELVREENAKTKKKIFVTDLSEYGFSAEELKMIGHILKAGALMDDLFQMQAGSYPFRDQLLLGATAADREMMDKYQAPWCYASGDPLCNGLNTFTPHVSPIYPAGMTKEEAKGDFSTPFTVVTRENGSLEAIPYAKSFLGPKMKEAAQELRKASALAVKVGEHSLGGYVMEVAQAFESDALFPYVKADEAWNQMKGHSKFYLRIGPDEVGWHPWQLKGGFHMSFGIIDLKAADAVARYGAIRQEMEEAVARVIGAPYQARQVEVSLPDFVNMVMENGDSRGGVSGTSIGQTLPNWCGDDGTGECPSRTMIFSNKLSKAYGEETMARYTRLLDAETMAYFRPDAVVQSIVDHEFAHNLGPMMNMQAADGKPIKDHLEDYTWKIEEMKAEVGSLFLNHWLGAVRGWYGEEQIRQGYVGVVGWMFGHLKRAYSYYKEGRLHESPSPYQLLSAVLLGRFVETGAVNFNETTKKFNVHFDKMPGVVADLLRDVGQLYMGHDKTAVVAFYDRYTKGDGLKNLHLDAIHEVLGDVPSSLYGYEIRGL